MNTATAKFSGVRSVLLSGRTLRYVVVHFRCNDTGSTPSESLPFLKIDGFYDEMNERFEVLL
jgi:hypothetical protein